MRDGFLCRSICGKNNHFKSISSQIFINGSFSTVVKGNKAMGCVLFECRGKVSSNNCKWLALFAGGVPGVGFFTGYLFDKIFTYNPLPFPCFLKCLLVTNIFCAYACFEGTMHTNSFGDSPGVHT